MEENGYLPVNSEKTIFIKRVKQDFIIHGLFVDDVKSIPTCKRLMDEFLKAYARDFDITGGTLMESFIGLQVEQPGGVIRLHLDNYIKETLAEYQEFDQRVLRGKLAPMQNGIVLTPDDCPVTPDKKRQSTYRSIVAKLQFASTWVRYDISFAVAQLARFCASAGPSHWGALRHLMGYLMANSSFKLEYRRRREKAIGLDGYCDADWANNVTRRSTTGNIFRYNFGPISWKSKLQKTISLSTAEAEYYSASTAAVEVIYLRNLLRELGFAPTAPTPIFEDNTACIEWGNNVIGGRERAKHIDIRKHFAHEAIQNGHLKLLAVSTSDQLADIFTKALSPALHAACLSKIMRTSWPTDRS